MERFFLRETTERSMCCENVSCGFCCVQASLDVLGVMGTSSGALSGSLYCAGYRPAEVAHELCQTPPIQIVRPNFCFWKGFFLLDDVVDRLRDLLPATFEALEKPFAVGVVNAKGEHEILDSGPLPEAVAASAAIPILFAPVTIPDNASSPFRDGGFRDRIGLQIWRQQRRKTYLQEDAPPAIVHLIGRSTPLSGSDDIRRFRERRVFVVHTQRSQRNFFSLGDYQREMTHTCDGLTPSVDKIASKVHKHIIYYAS